MLGSEQRAGAAALREGFKRIGHTDIAAHPVVRRNLRPAIEAIAQVEIAAAHHIGGDRLDPESTEQARIDADRVELAAVRCDIRERRRKGLGAATRQAAQQLWSARWQQYVSRDALTGKLLDAPTSAGLLAAYAGFDRDCAGTVAQWLQETPYGLPSTRSTAPGFEPRRYWRGPVWAPTTMLLWDGLLRQGRADMAADIARRLARRRLAARTLQVNGMYRHGYMIAPALHDVVLDVLEGGTSARAAEFDLSMQLL